MLTYKKNLEGSITILGENGTVKVGGVAVNDIQHWEFDEPKDYDNEILALAYSNQLQLQLKQSQQGTQKANMIN